jgi:hypothetical protein
MPHAYWHIIECGSVGSQYGEPTSPGQWIKYSRGIVAYRGSELVKPYAKKIATIIGDLVTAPVSKRLKLPGGYFGFGIGVPESPVDIPPLAQYSDAFLTVIFDAEGSDESTVSAAYARIAIERAKAYLKVYEQTGGLITFSYGVHHEHHDHE